MAVRTGSFSRAAHELNIQPQTVSKAITDLENKLGFPLFIPSGRTIKPTPDCLLLFEPAETMVSARQLFKSTAHRIAQSPKAVGSLTIALATQPYRGRTISALDFEPFRARNPDLDLKILEMDNSACLVALVQCKVNAAILLGPIGTNPIRSVRLYAHRVVVALSRKNKLAQRDAILLSDLAQMPVAHPSDFAFCMDQYEYLTQSRGLSFDLVQVHPTPKDLASFIAHGGALLVFDDPSLSALYPNAVFLPLLPKDSISVPVHLAQNMNGDNRLFPFLEAFAQTLARSRMRIERHDA